MPAKMRSTDIAKELENFLDANEEDLSPRMFAELEDVAENLEDLALELANEIQELQSEVTELKKELEEN